jgi:predicted DNA-binding protein (MmcQ/YjbR family)
MNIEEFREYCLAKKGVEETFPFGETTLVFKVMGKMFALTGLDGDAFTVNLKCDPDRAIELRESFPQVRPGYHMNKKHWNTVEFENGLPDDLLTELVDHSYDLVVRKMPKKLREELEKI